MSFFDEPEETRTEQRTAPRRRRPTGGGRRPRPGNDQAILVRRIVLVAGVVLAIIVIALLVNSCESNAHKSALKDYNNNVDIEPIAKLRFRLELRPPGTIGVIFTRKEVTDPARYLVRNSFPKNILLWQGDEIELALEQKRLTKGLLTKFRHAVEHGLPDFNLKAEALP